jgi:hypothetical protein
MKSFSLLPWVGLLCVSSAFGQGTVVFHNKVENVDARVFILDWRGLRPLDGQFVGQLYASVPGGTLAAAGAPIPFRDAPEAGRGYLNTTGLDTTRQIPGVPEGGTAQVKMVAWATSLGATYEQAIATGMGWYGESAVVPEVVTGGGLVPPRPLTGLQGFTILIIPEPSTVALGLLGAGVLLIRRRE